MLTGWPRAQILAHRGEPVTHYHVQWAGVDGQGVAWPLEWVHTGFVDQCEELREAYWESVPRAEWDQTRLQVVPCPTER